MFVGLLGLVAVVLIVSALGSRTRPVPAGADGTPIPAEPARPTRLPPKPVTAFLAILAAAAAIASAVAVYWINRSTFAGQTFSRAQAIRSEHASVAFLLVVLAPIWLAIIGVQLRTAIVNRGRSRARGIIGPESPIGAAYRTLGRTSALAAATAGAAYVLVAVVIIRHFVS